MHRAASPNKFVRNKEKAQKAGDGGEVRQGWGLVLCNCVEHFGVGSRSRPQRVEWRGDVGMWLVASEPLF